MKKEVMEKWVEALRSGKYKQGKGALKRNNNYCCLGVLCEISGISKFDEYDNYLGHMGTLPLEVMKYSDIKNNYGNFLGQQGRIYLILLNDEGKSFNEIADIIEENWKNI